MSGEVKIVIILKEGTALVGFQKPDCDPIFSKVEGELPAVLERIPGLVEEAQRSWDSNPRYPKCETELKPPPQPAARQAAQRSSQRQAAAIPQKPMF